MATPTGTSIASSGYDSGTGVLTLTGPASNRDFETVPRDRQVPQHRRGPDNTGRSVTFAVNDGTDDSNTGTTTVTMTRSTTRRSST